jgi:hypothetical protein
VWGVVGGLGRCERIFLHILYVYIYMHIDT